MIDPIKLLLKVAKEKHIDDKWIGKPLYLIKILPNSNKGDLAEAFVKEYCNALGFKAEKEHRLGDFDVMINNKKFEVKMATEDLTGNFQFNHIRMDFDYDWLICFGVSHSDIFFEIYRKEDVVMKRAGVLVPMGKGHNADWKLTKKKSVLLPISKFKEKLTICFKK